MVRIAADRSANLLIMYIKIGLKWLQMIETTLILTQWAVTFKLLAFLIKCYFSTIVTIVTIVMMAVW